MQVNICNTRHRQYRLDSRRFVSSFWPSSCKVDRLNKQTVAICKHLRASLQQSGVCLIPFFLLDLDHSRPLFDDALYVLWPLGDSSSRRQRRHSSRREPQRKSGCQHVFTRASPASGPSMYQHEDPRAVYHTSGPQITLCRPQASQTISMQSPRAGREGERYGRRF